MSQTEPIPILMDVDTGVDDAMALALALRWPGFELTGVTTVAGNVSLDRVTENTLRVLAWLGAEEVPVYAGMAGPLVRPLRTAPDSHGAGGLGGFTPPPSGALLAESTAPEAMVRAARERPGDMVFVCTGPLTNLAVAIGLEPDLPRLLRHVVIMGGAFTVPGNVTKAAEFNIYVDPEAAAAVARSGLPITYIGLDVTRQVPITRSEWDLLAGQPSAEARLVHGVCRELFEDRGAEGVSLHDPLAVAVAARPGLVTTERSAVLIDTSVWASAGATRLVRDASLPQHQIAIGVDTAAFHDLFWATLNLARG